MHREITQNTMKGTIKAIAKGVVEKVSGIDFDAGGVMKSKGIDKFATLTEGWGKERHQCVKCKSIWESGLIAAIEITAGNGRGVEGKAHMRKTGANELCIDRGVMRQGRANKIFMIIKLFCECML